MKKKFISIVIPLYNEKGNITPLFQQIHQVMQNLKVEYEIIFVDDGSTDGSDIVLGELYKGNRNDIKVVMFRRNFGKSAALCAGFDIAQGKFIFTMDGDLQDDPTEIPKFLATLDGVYDLLSGWKFPRRDPILKRLPSKIFNFVTSRMTGVRLHDFNCGFKLYRREVVENISIYGELHRYIPVFAHQLGFKIGEVKVNHRPRTWGKSKYGNRRLFIGFLDLITALFITKFIRKPLHLFGFAGIISIVCGITIDIYLTIIRIMGERIGNRPLLVLGNLLIIVGIQFILMGLIGDMMSKVFQGQSPEYSVKRYLGVKEGEWSSKEERIKREKL
jgi:glycosyltransferase involved in cell wall biosynthesis